MAPVPPQRHIFPDVVVSGEAQAVIVTEEVWKSVGVQLQEAERMMEPVRAECLLANGHMTSADCVKLTNNDPHLIAAS